ncbi:extracellular solute-binding protein [Halomonas sp. SH5A2]|uniref:ABC transporter substrate-binding protein n=1 Tax=Halomonas sp. SH5A2 TaxID=2749040 RepID=UPI001641B1BF|nr:extracellular solute-binding protein [Halomonas sp. SH5A2]QNI03347.1 extracellular solute-binding protein [Halomonas sp. SH5A2]
MKTTRLLTATGLGLAMASGSTIAMAEDVTLHWALHPGEEADAVINYFAPEYERQTGVKVVGEILPPDQLRDRMSIEAIGGTGRWDMGYHSPGWFGSFKDHVVDLSPYIEKYDFNVDAYPERIRESHMENSARPGEIIALPTTPAAPMLIVREDFFSHPDEQAAFEEEYGRALEVPSTWQELYEVGEFFTREAGETVAGETLEEDLYGWTDALGAGSGLARSFIVMLYSTGLEGWDENYQPDLDHPILVDAANLFVDLANDVAPRAARNWDFLEGLSYFRDGRLAMATMWPQGLSTVEDPQGEAAGNVGYQPLPAFEGNLKDYPQGVPFLGGGGVFVMDTENSEEAFKFLKWMLQDNEIEWGKRTKQFSRVAHFNSEELRDLEPHYDDFLPAYEQTLEHVFVRQGIPEYGTVMWQGTVDFATDVLSGDLTPEQAQDRWVDNMTRTFQRAGYLER